MTVPDELAALLDQLWEQSSPVLAGRLDAVLAALDAPQATGRQAAAREAHSLAGALGTYGRPGSPLLAQVEKALLREPDPVAEAALAGQVRALRAELGL